MQSLIVRGQKPQLFMFHILVRRINIATGKDQNYDPTARKLEEEGTKQDEEVENQPLAAESIQKDGEKDEDGENSVSEEEEEEEIETLITEEEDDEIEKDGKKGKGKKGKGKKGGKKKGKGKKKPKKNKHVLPHPPLLPPPPPPYYKLLPPFSLGFRIVDEEPHYVEQINLPAEAPPRPLPPAPPKVIVIPKEESKEVLPKVSIRQTKTTIQDRPNAAIPPIRETKRIKKKKKDKKKKGKKGDKKKTTKKPEAPAEVLPPPPPPCPYSAEELRWKLKDEKWFGRGLLLLVSKSADDVISWVQKGYMPVEVCRWKGYGEREKIASASVCLPSRMSEMALRATNKDETLPLVVNCEGEAKIRDLEWSEIGSLSVDITLTCYGDSWSSPLLLSSCGLEAMLSSCPLTRSEAEEKRRRELDDMYDVSNLIELLRMQNDRRTTLNLPITFEDIMCATC